MSYDLWENGGLFFANTKTFEHDPWLEGEQQNGF
jgi:hypothetical protein